MLPPMMSPLGLTFFYILYYTKSSFPCQAVFGTIKDVRKEPRGGDLTRRPAVGEQPQRLHKYHCTPAGRRDAVPAIRDLQQPAQNSPRFVVKSKAKCRAEPREVKKRAENNARQKQNADDQQVFLPFFIGAKQHKQSRARARE